MEKDAQGSECNIQCMSLSYQCCGLSPKPESLLSWEGGGRRGGAGFHNLGKNT